MLAISRAIRKTPTPDGAILLDVERGQMFCLNVIGAEILELFGAGYSEAQIAAHVSAAYGENTDTVHDDVRDFLEALNRHHILRPGEPVTKESGATHGSPKAT